MSNKQPHKDMFIMDKVSERVRGESGVLIGVLSLGRNRATEYEREGRLPLMRSRGNVDSRH